MIGVLGCGNMASAIVKGIHSKFTDIKFLTYTPSFTRAHDLAFKVNGTAVKKLSELDECKILIIGCKPQQFQELATSLRSEINLENKIIISIMAAVSTSSIKKQLGISAICRVMPNTPALINEGVSLIYHAEEVTSDDKKRVESYFSACSQVHVLETEELFDKVTVVTGSGPAYVYYFAKTMVDSLESWGVNGKEAREMVTQLFIGAASLMNERKDKTLGELIDEVTSKGGVTIEAINTFKENNLNEITDKALDAAYKRSLELTRSF